MPHLQPRVFKAPDRHPNQLISEGPLIAVEVTIPDYVADLRGGDRPVARTMALLDTGASHTAISADMAAALQLVPSGQRMVVGANGKPEPKPEYVTNILFPGGEIEFVEMRVSEVDLHGAAFSMLIGRDLMSWLYFHYDGALAGYGLEFPSPSHPLHMRHHVPPPPSAPKMALPGKPKLTKKARQRMAKQARKQNG